MGTFAVLIQIVLKFTYEIFGIRSVIVIMSVLFVKLLKLRNQHVYGLFQT